jgi:hypothetical protein
MRVGPPATNPGSLVFPWTLQSTGPERLPKIVYVRGPGGFSGDDIILDETAPVVTAVQVLPFTAGKVAAARVRRRLRIAARDRTSGVARVQIAGNPRRPGRWFWYGNRVRYPVSGVRVFVRVRDRAGNRSRWRSIALSGGRRP